MSTLHLSSSSLHRGIDVPASLFGYDVIGWIGQGAGSWIYAVSDPASKQVYALKHVVPQTEREQRFIEQLENEFEVGRQLNHPKVRRVLDLKANRTLLRKVTDAALLMELFDGEPLDMQPSTLSLPSLLNCFIQTAQALSAMHAAGFVHCDLKPNNILVSAHGDVKVIDLGQACKFGTTKQRIQGTPDYIAPEQVKCNPITDRTDIFNLGATMYWALSGRKMPTLFTLKKAENSFLLDEGIPAPHTLNPAIPENLSSFVMECVRTNPLKRPANIGEVIHRLHLLHHTINWHSGNGQAQAQAQAIVA